jgi:hypothetical protein
MSFITSDKLSPRSVDSSELVSPSLAETSESTTYPSFEAGLFDEEQLITKAAHRQTNNNLVKKRRFTYKQFIILKFY